ncbi:hypothetical protein BJ508DRAFT_141558 [Ascobolus immersus RN42]|uniref:Uncharacterized protein n=1 Tax=Ascobolus immersus RN42 TaxID=1160509 RepID=A0A3N4ICM9_ASCIM|nr:hypothetical protein BJ508DRAFT_141558 [Ascobolus immersus RN42]
METSFQARAERRSGTIFKLQLLVLALLMASIGILSAILWSPRFEFGRQWSSHQAHSSIISSWTVSLVAYFYTLFTFTDKLPFVLGCGTRKRNLAPAAFFCTLLLISSIAETITTGWPAGLFIDEMVWGKDSQKSFHIWNAVVSGLLMLSAIAYLWITSILFSSLLEGRIRLADDDEESVGICRS